MHSPPTQPFRRAPLLTAAATLAAAAMIAACGSAGPNSPSPSPRNGSSTTSLDAGVLQVHARQPCAELPRPKQQRNPDRRRQRTNDLGQRGLARTRPPTRPRGRSARSTCPVRPPQPHPSRRRPNDALAG